MTGAALGPGATDTRTTSAPALLRARNQAVTEGHLVESKAAARLLRGGPVSIGIAAMPLVEPYNRVAKLAAGQMDLPEVRARESLRVLAARSDIDHVG